MLLKFANGMMGQILTSWAFPAPTSRRVLFSIAGEAGQLWGEPEALYSQPVGFRSPAIRESPGWNSRRTVVAEIEHFVHAIEQQVEPLQSLADATEILRVILAAYDSTDSNRIVSLVA